MGTAKLNAVYETNLGATQLLQRKAVHCTQLANEDNYCCSNWNKRLC